MEVRESSVACDIRTTVHDVLLDGAALARLASDLAALGVRDHRLQPFRQIGRAMAAPSAQDGTIEDC